MREGIGGMKSNVLFPCIWKSNYVGYVTSDKNHSLPNLAAAAAAACVFLVSQHDVVFSAVDDCCNVIIL